MDPRRRGTAILPIVVLVAACTALPTGSGAPSARVDSQPPATAPPSPSASKELVATADGYTLTVTVDRQTLAPGETATFTATFQNGTDKPIDVAGSTCDAGMNGLVSVRLPQEPLGKTWTDFRQVLKDYVLGKGFGPGAVPALDPLMVNFSAIDCGDYTISSELAAGQSVGRTMSWKAQIVGGVDALEGSVPFTVSVGYDQQNGPPSYPPGYHGPLISWSPMFKQLSVSGELEVVGQRQRIVGPGEAIDSLLANKKFAAWLTDRPAATWSNANLFLYSSPRAEGILPKGPVWDIELFRERLRNWAIAFVDPFDASLMAVHYCNVPCDR